MYSNQRVITRNAEFSKMLFSAKKIDFYIVLTCLKSCLGLMWGLLNSASAETGFRQIKVSFRRQIIVPIIQNSLSLIF